MEVLHGSTPDISPLMQYQFWEPVYYLIEDKQNFPSKSQEKMGRFVGIAETVGDSMTFKVLTDDTEKVIYKAKQSFAYSVLHHTLLTDMGKTLVRQHLDTLDAQTVYKELCAYHAKSTNAKVNASALLTYITTVRFDTTWRGTAQAFLLHWKNQLRQLDDIQPDSDRFSKPLRKVMLENAVHAVEELRSVKALEDHNVTLGKDPLSYEEYFQWLHSAAARFDSETANKKRFKVQQTLSAPHHSSYDLQDDDDYGIGYPTQPTCTVCKIDMSPGEFLAANMTQGMPSSGSHGRGEMRCPNPKDSNRLTIPTTRVMGKDV